MIVSSKFYDYYLAPDIEVVKILVEAGFQTSSNIEDPVEDNFQNWQ